MSTANPDARAAEEMADSMLRDSPIPKTEEEHKQSEDVPVGKFVIPSPPISTFLTVFCFLLEEFLLGPLNQEDPIRPRAVGLLIGIECSRVRDSSWMYLTSFCNNSNRRRTSCNTRKLPDRVVVGLQLYSARTFHVILSPRIYKGG